MTAIKQGMICLFLASCLSAGLVDTVTFHSKLLERKIHYLVFKPFDYADNVKKGHRYPVVYMLHCAGGEATDWVGNYGPGVQDLIDSVDLMAVAPFDGSGYTWWVDSPVQPKARFSSFLAKELKPRIDSIYASLPHRECNGLVGFSMGGFGVFHNLMEHPDAFGAAFGVCSATDLVRWTGAWGLNQVLGDPPKHMDQWRDVNIVDNVAKLKDAGAKIRFYSTSDDFFLDENRLLDSLLTLHGVAHRYDEYQGDHAYPSNAQMLQILRYFNTAARR